MKKLLWTGEGRTLGPELSKFDRQCGVGHPRVLSLGPSIKKIKNKKKMQYSCERTETTIAYKVCTKTINTNYYFIF